MSTVQPNTFLQTSSFFDGRLELTNLKIAEQDEEIVVQEALIDKQAIKIVRLETMIKEQQETIDMLKGRINRIEDLLTASILDKHALKVSVQTTVVSSDKVQALMKEIEERRTEELKGLQKLHETGRRQRAYIGADMGISHLPHDRSSLSSLPTTPKSSLLHEENEAIASSETISNATLQAASVEKVEDFFKKQSEDLQKSSLNQDEVVIVRIVNDED